MDEKTVPELPSHKLFNHSRRSLGAIRVAYEADKACVKTAECRRREGLDEAGVADVAAAAGAA